MLVGIGLAFLSCAALCAAGASIQSLFGSGLSPATEIFLPSDTNYTQEITQRWDVFRAPTYLGAIKPATEHDLRVAVQWAAKHGIPFLATGGGHGASTTLAEIRNGVDIDLGNFNSVHLDARANRLTVGGGAHFSQAIDLLYTAGKELPTVSSSCVGIVGATLGAGLGTLQGLHGVLLDSLESVRLVTASGEIVNASQTHNSDLFWGIRGAGHNFGIVTSATYRVYNATNHGQVTNGDFLFPPSANASVWELMASFDDSLPPELALTFFVIRDPSSPSTLPVIAINGQYFGPEEQAMRYFQPILALNPIRTNVSSVPWNNILDAAFFGQTSGSGACTRNSVVNIFSLALKQTHVPTWVSHFNDLGDFLTQHPSYYGRLLIQRFPTQGMQRVPDDATAYPFRDAKIQLNMEGWYTNRTLDAPVTDFLRTARAKFQETSGFADLAVYTNYAHGDEGPEAWYSRRKLGRLAALKKRWDPEGVFSWYNAVPLRH